MAWIIARKEFQTRNLVAFVNEIFLKNSFEKLVVNFGHLW